MAFLGPVPSDRDAILFRPMSEALFLLVGLAAGAIAALLLTRPRLTSLVRERDAERSTRR